jgi:hypothetical protein
MPDVNVKLVSQQEVPQAQEHRASSYLLNVEVLDNLKHAIREARGTQSSDAEANQK